MTEQQWLENAEAPNPGPVMEFLRGKASDRKLRLFAVACVRRIWNLLPDERCRRAVEVAERFADGICNLEELQAATEAASKSTDKREIRFARNAAVFAAMPSAGEAGARVVRQLWGAVLTAASDDPYSPARSAANADVQRYRKTLFHDIFGPLLFRSITLDPSWRTSTVTALAEAMYDERAFEGLPILADALEESGCTNAEILSHCREPGEHVRGCWVVDLVLGRE